MNHLHSEGIVHGDLKAGNVLLKAELRPVAFDAAEPRGVGCASSMAGGGLHSTAAGTSGPSCSNVAGALGLGLLGSLCE
jgi:serine/threonine protein kinase